MGNPSRRLLRPQVHGPGLLALALTFAACAAGDDPSGTSAAPTAPTTTAPAPATSSITPPEEEAVEAAYREFWDAYLEAADPMDPSDPVLAEHAVNPQLERLQGSFLARRSSGEVIRGTLDLAPSVERVEGGTAFVSDCYADSTGVYDAESGERKDTASGVRHEITSELVLDGAVWKVRDITREGEGCQPA